jgi:hypothetical protein
VSESEALADYLQGGWRLINPHPLFDTEYFLETYGAGAEFTDPLDLYKKVSARERVNTTPFLHLDWALERLGSRLEPNEDPVLNYILTGVFVGWQVNPLYDLVVPAGTEPMTFWDSIDTIDDLVERYDTRRLVTADWLSQTYGYPAGAAHDSFWRDRPNRKQWWPFSPELLFGPIGAETGVSISEYAEAFSRSIRRSPEWTGIAGRMKGAVQLVGYRGEIYHDGWIGRVSELVVEVSATDGVLELEFYAPGTMPPHRVAVRVEADPGFSTDYSRILEPGEVTTTPVRLESVSANLRIRIRCDAHRGTHDARYLGAVLSRVEYKPTRTETEDSPVALGA